jgi:hypothetical protein
MQDNLKSSNDTSIITLSAFAIQGLLSFRINFSTSAKVDVAILMATALTQ